MNTYLRDATAIQGMPLLSGEVLRGDRIVNTLYSVRHLPLLFARDAETDMS